MVPQLIKATVIEGHLQSYYALHYAASIKLLLT